MKLIIVGQASCRPCVAMKNQILDRVDELEALGASFEYIDLNELENKDEFIQENKLTATPTSWVEFGGFVSERFSGYVDIDTLFEFVGECKSFWEERK